MKKYVKTGWNSTSNPMTDEQIIAEKLPIACREHLQRIVDVCGATDECDIRIYEYLTALQDCGRITYQDRMQLWNIYDPSKEM